MRPAPVAVAARLIKVHRHLPRRYYSEPNGATILLGRVDLRVDHGHFKNHITIQEVPKADGPARRSRIGSGTGRHGGRPSQEQTANPTLPT
jgi:hypothetical protein